MFLIFFIPSISRQCVLNAASSSHQKHQHLKMQLGPLFFGPSSRTKQFGPQQLKHSSSSSPMNSVIPGIMNATTSQEPSSKPLTQFKSQFFLMRQSHSRSFKTFGIIRMDRWQSEAIQTTWKRTTDGAGQDVQLAAPSTLTIQTWEGSQSSTIWLGLTQPSQASEQVPRLYKEQHQTGSKLSVKTHWLLSPD